MATTTVFESPTALGAKIITISTTITNTSGAYTDTISDERLTASMKAIKLELGNPAAFDAVINVAVNNGSLTITCASVTGTSTAVISVLKTCDDPTAITTTEFDVLANRIGDLDDLETTAKTDLVSAVNENSQVLGTIPNWQSVTLGTPSSGSLVSGSYLIKSDRLKLAIFNVQINGASAGASLPLNITTYGAIDKPIYGYNAYNNVPVNCAVSNNSLILIEAAALVRVFGILPIS